MKKSYIPHVVFGTLLVTLFIFGTYKSNVTPQKTTDDNYNYKKSNQEIKNISPKNNEYFYLVKEKNNEIFLFDNNMNMIEKLNINFSGLREYDKKLFANGIYFDNINDVYRLIEDFSN